MTHIVEHKIFRYTWELVRHTYIVDLESEIEIRQVEIFPARQNRLLNPPYQVTSFFEIEIDQIQKNGKTVFSFRNICPVEINRNAASTLLNSLIKTGSPRVTKRFQSQEGETETRWLYADDFFLISLSSSDRHDLSMLVSQILGKLNMIALSIQSGRRISSELENQQKYRAAMNTMFSEGVDGAFRDVPVYQKHGEVTGSMPAVSIPRGSVPVDPVSAEQGTNGRVRKEYTPAWSIHEESIPVEETGAESILAERAGGDTAPALSIREESIPVEKAGAESILAERVDGDTAPARSIPEESIPVEEAGADSVPAGSASALYVITDSILEESAPAKALPAAGAPVESIPESIPAEAVSAENAGAGKFCGRCGSEISGTTRFCGRCGTAVSTALPAECVPATAGIPAKEDAGKVSSARTTSDIIVDLKPIEELQDLSWLSD